VDTTTADGTLPAASVAGARATAPAWTAICSYLRDVTGSWRATTASSEHRCGAIEPPGPLTAETQRSLCLVAAHLECPLYRHAQQASGTSHPATEQRLQRYPDTTAVILERPSGVALALARARESLPQVGLLFLIALAAAALVLARFIAP
jgi:hypothetical protein